MSAVERGARRGICLLALVALFVGASASSAAAAPSLGLDLSGVLDHDDVQAIYVEATTGQFRLSFDGQETGDIAATATPAAVENALNALSNISSDGVSVTNSVLEANGLRPYLVTFDGGPFATKLQPLLSVRSGTTPLGASPLGGGPARAYVETRIPGGISRSDERVDYKVKVSNSAASDPAVGDTLSCDAENTPSTWFNGPASFTFKWIRSGNLASPVSESTAPASPTPVTSTYLVQPGDAGHALQCEVVGGNAGGAAASFSPPITILPIPTPPPPAFVSGNPRPTVLLANGGAANVGVRFCAPPTSWLGPALAVASTTSGSNQLTSVAGSSSFAVGQEISASGVPAGTTITAVGAGTLTMSANATATAAGIGVVGISAGSGTLTAGSNVVTSFLAAAGTGTVVTGSTSVTALGMTVGRWAIGLPISGAGIPAGTTVTATSGATLTLSQPATASGVGVFLSSEGPNPFAVGEEIRGPGIPAGATVTAVGAGTLTLSAAATASSASVSLTAATDADLGFQWLRNGQLIAGGTGASYSLSTTGTATTASGSNQLTGVITARGSGTLSSGSATITGVSTLTGGFVVGQTIDGTGIPAGATILSVGATSLEISAPATESGAQALVAGAQPFAVGQKINGAGIPANSTITAISGQTVTISANATASATVAVAAGADVATNLQCAVVLKRASGGPPSGGAVFAISNNSVIPTPSPTVPNNNAALFTGTPKISFANATTGTVTVEVKMPTGAQSAAYLPGTGGSGWSCVAQPPAGVEPAKAVCTRSDALAPGASYPTLDVAVGLGADAPTTSTVEAIASGGGAAAPASASDQFVIDPPREFGLIPGRFRARALGASGEDFTQAGGHPALAETSLSLTRFRALVDGGFLYNRHRPVQRIHNAIGEVPAGFIGNPQAVPELCADTSLMLQEPSACPPASIIGEVGYQSHEAGSTGGVEYKRMALYAMEPEDGVPAEFAAAEPINGGVYVLIPHLRPEDGYALSIESSGLVEKPEFLDLRVTICGFGANSRNIGSTTYFASCKQKNDAGAFVKPFLTTQAECVSNGPITQMRMDSWAARGDYKTYQAESPKMTGCDLVPFDPELELQPTATQAESSSGLGVDLTMPTDAFEDPDEIAQAHLKKTTVTFPPGMTVNPSSADGLEACTQAQVGMVDGVPNDEPVRCPSASKLGTAVVKTPILEEALEGSIYLAKQGENPFGTLVAVYVVVESKERGILIKLPGKVEFKAGGQIVSTFDDNPQAPFSSLELDFFSGPRAALMTPQRCGSYQVVSELTPWSAADPDSPTPAETVTQTSTFHVTSGPGGGPCPTGALVSTMNAGISNTTAGSSSPFVFSLSRADGTQRFNGLTMSLPPGLAANLSGVPYCSDATLASIPSAQGSGVAEIANPSCPEASRIGSVAVGAGTGNPFFVNGSVYLAGPYKGAPLSLAVVVPAVAGPFDLGNVVVRNAVFLNPRTAQVSIKSDPLPTQLHNLPVDVRNVRVTVDRPGFIQAPTNCEPMQIDAVVSGEEGGSTPVSSRFQVGECGSLDFGPKLKLKYKGATKVGGNPGLRAVLTQPGGQANISSAQVILPKGSFIDNAHINNPCTRAQYAEGACPKSSILGWATAWSPLLDEPLTGPVYFRSNGGERELPDIVAALNGQVSVELVGYIDAIENKKNGTSRVRNTFAIVPDAPVSRFELSMKGGKFGLIENSKNLCKGENKATVKMNAHNGMVQQTTPQVATDCRKKKGKSGKGGGKGR